MYSLHNRYFQLSMNCFLLNISVDEVWKTYNLIFLVQIEPKVVMPYLHILLPKCLKERISLTFFIVVRCTFWDFFISPYINIHRSMLDFLKMKLTRRGRIRLVCFIHLAKYICVFLNLFIFSYFKLVLHDSIMQQNKDAIRAS